MAIFIEVASATFYCAFAVDSYAPSKYKNKNLNHVGNSVHHATQWE
jgi:hypothetical protein